MVVIPFFSSIWIFRPFINTKLKTKEVMVNSLLFFIWIVFCVYQTVLQKVDMMKD